MKLTLPTKMPFVKYPLSSIPTEIKSITDIDCVKILIRDSNNVIVNEGDIVKIGQPLTSKPYFGSFASVSGVVDKIVPFYGEIGHRFREVIIRKTREGDFFNIFPPSDEPLSVDKEELVKRISLCGIENIKEDTAFLIVGADDDIGKVSNRYIMKNYSKKILEGIGVINKIFSKNKIFLAVTNDIKDAFVNNVENEKLQHIEIINIKPYYPYTFLPFIISLLKRDNITVVTCKKLFDIVNTLKNGYVLPAQFVSVQIGQKKETLLFDTPPGITVGQLLKAGGVKIDNNMEIIVGGEMRGKTIWSLDDPLEYMDESILIRFPKEVSLSQNEHCVNCGRCSDVCPVRLRVDIIGKAVEYSIKDEVVKGGVANCIKCGLCDSVCIVNRPLMHLIASGVRRYIEEKEQEKWFHR